MKFLIRISIELKMDVLFTGTWQAKGRYIYTYHEHTKVFARPLALRESGRHARSYVIEYRNI